MRVFLAHAKGHADDTHIQGVVSEVPRVFPGAQAVLAVDAWRQSFASAGSWDAWAEDVAVGRDWQGVPNYDAFIVFTEYVGRSTSQILTRALAVPKPIIYYPKGGRPLPVSAVLAVPGSESWTHGWRIDT